jgi:hypothetical protein
MFDLKVIFIEDCKPFKMMDSALFSNYFYYYADKLFKIFFYQIIFTDHQYLFAIIKVFIFLKNNFDLYLSIILNPRSIIALNKVFTLIILICLQSVLN